jgi:hypothetical protein
METKGDAPLGGQSLYARAFVDAGLGVIGTARVCANVTSDAAVWRIEYWQPPSRRRTGARAALARVEPFADGPA